MLNFENLVLSNGTVLVNVPCDEKVLIDLGFDAAEAHERCSQVKLETAWAKIRTKRNSLLAACDYTQMPDYPLTDEQKTAWSDYRQQLRDITDTFAETGPESVVWPEEPA